MIGFISVSYYSIKVMHHLYLILKKSKLGRRNFVKKTYGNKLAMHLQPIQQAHQNIILKKVFALGLHS